LERQSYALGVIWYRNPPEQRQRWHEHVRRSADHAGVSLHVHQIDNSPASESASIALTEALPTTTLPSRGNIGFAGGQNALMQSAWDSGATYYIGLNPDALLHREALRHFLDVASVRRDDLVEMRQFPLEHEKHYDPLSGETEWISGCAFGISSKLWSRIGGFDESMFMYCEDVDLSWRAREAGARCYTAYRALVHHNIANRMVNATHAVMLQSVWRLGVKWGLPDLCAFARLHLRHHNAAPPADDIDETELVPRAPGIARFTENLAFSSSRWQL
jgi:hypothetical protein